MRRRRRAAAAAAHQRRAAGAPRPRQPRLHHRWVAATPAQRALTRHPPAYAPLFSTQRSSSLTAAGRGRAASPRRATRKTRARSCLVRARRRPARLPSRADAALRHAAKASPLTARRWARPSPCWCATRTSAAATTARCRCVVRRRERSAPRSRMCRHARAVLSAPRAGCVPAQPRGRDVRHEVRRARHRGASLPRAAARAPGAETLTHARPCRAGRRPLVGARDHRARGRRRHRQEDLGAGGWR